MESIVKVPQHYADSDYDYIAFSFAGKHSYEDMGIYRISDNNGYQLNLNPTIADTIVDIPGGDGQYYFNTQHKNKVFNIKFAFDNLTEKQFQELKAWLNGKETGDLWFSEEPYKVYTAKVTGSATITTVPFQGTSNNGVYGGNIYKGTGSVTFTCYHPYAHTPDKVVYNNYEHDGKAWSSYVEGFPRVHQKLLPGFPEDGGIYPYGQIPFSFVAKLGDLNGNEAKSYSVSYNMDNSGSSVDITDVNEEEISISGTSVSGEHVIVGE